MSQAGEELDFYPSDGLTAQQRYEREVRAFVLANGPQDPETQEREIAFYMRELYPDWTAPTSAEETYDGD